MQQGSVFIALLLKRWIKECRDEKRKKKLVELLTDLTKPKTNEQDR
jgi:hypothetical protein